MLKKKIKNIYNLAKKILNKKILNKKIKKI